MVQNWRPHRRAGHLIWGGLLCALICLSFACETQPKQFGNVTEDDLIEFTGVVTWVDVEGGFWGIVRDESEAKYRPINLPKEYQADGRHVRVACHRIQGGISIHQWGQEIKIAEIESIK